MTKSENSLPFAHVYKALYPYLKPHLAWFLLGSIFILASTAIETLLPMIVGWSVEYAINGRESLGALKKMCGLFLILIFFKSIIDMIQAYVIQRTGQGISHDLRCALFEKISSLSVSYFDRNPTGRLLTRVVNDIKSLSELFTASISVLALDVLVIVGTLVAMLYIHFKLAVCVLASFPFVVWTIIYFGKKQADAYREVRRHLSEINAFLGENISGIPTIQRLRAEQSRLNSFAVIVRRHQAAQNKSLRLFALVQPFANILNGIGMAALLGMGGYLVVNNEVGLGIIIAFLGYLRNLYQPVRDLVEKYNTFVSAYVSSERVVRILDETSEGAMDPPARCELPEKLSIEFAGVSFKYPNRKAYALQGVSFKLEESKSLAIVGATGSGKSSVVRLLLKFYDPDSGTVLVGGRSLSDWNRKELRSVFGMIHQEVYLFAGTLRENLTMGRLGVDDENLVERCENAQLWEVVRERGGLNFQIFEGGSNLSLGEKQLINFARILIMDPRVLIFDEATSSIDRILEEKILLALSKVLKGRTSIAIAHRLSTIETCDEILVLEKGCVVEHGRYSELLARDGALARFHKIYANS